MASIFKEAPKKLRLAQRPSIKVIIDKTAEEFSVSIESIMTSFLGRGVKNQPRKIVMYIAKKICDYSLKEIMYVLNLKPVKRQ